MKIGMISQWYEPETGSAAHPAAIARALAARGHEVQVLTGYPSYPQGRVHSGYRMSLRQQEEREGVRLLRVPDVPSHDDNALRRAASLTSFAASATLQVGWLRDVDVCLVYLTPATVGAAAMALRATAGVPYVLYVQDLWPETVTASGFIGQGRATRAVERGITGFLTRLYRRAEGIAAISPTMARTLTGRGAVVVPESVPNWVDETVFRPPGLPLGASPLPPSRSWIMYAGGIGDVQALEHAVHAISLLPDREDIGLALVGDGVARPGLEALAQRLQVSERVCFLGPRPMAEMPGLMASSVAQLVSLRDLELFRGTIPSKLQASMACGAPVLCSVAGDAAELVERVRCGLTVTPETPSELAAAMRALVDLPPAERAAMGDRGRAAYERELSSDAGAAHLERMLETAAQRRRR
ncbi:glycosyltransferase family 4 protein [Nocardioides sp. cx-173]|uniref:glycosyltransferase family 4 protein n=1 Tax=Nocardioides sp. cx-173 TaxID=2898796 RepID=UPI001E58089F|nr:glycosyltransferase family 4 protein [Nocardioides sp. cx-173]MCD4523761.1 glycosyltransferase family 4 protein [Nocardioides sp. cx-173]UGB41915.1 glycosyltransferase family 4 protein [Nocardioides sp. cx-173]